MSRKMNRREYWLLFVVLLSAFALHGCAAGKLRSTDEMEKSNPMKSVAIVGYGNIMAKYRNYENAINLGYSKKAVSFLAEGLQTELKKKGYHVAYSKPVGVGFSAKASREKNVAYDDSVNGKLGFELITIDNSKPAYVFPGFDAETEDSAQIKSALLGYSSSTNLKDYTPDIGQMEKIGKHAGVDTVCLLAVTGRKVSKTDKMREEAEENLSRMMKRPPPPSTAGREELRAELMCVNLELKKVVWHDYASAGFTGEEPNLFVAARLLKDFPEMGKPLDPRCQRPEKTKPLYLCDTK